MARASCVLAILVCLGIQVFLTSDPAARAIYVATIVWVAFTADPDGRGEG